MYFIQQMDIIAIGIMTAISIIFIILCTRAFNNLDAGCPSQAIRSGWAFNQTISFCILTAGLVYAACTLFGDCYSNMDANRTGDYYLFIFMLFFTIMVIINSVMLTRYKKIPEKHRLNCDNESGSTKRANLTLLIISVIAAVSAAAIFGVNLYRENKGLV
jgi:hypothetical protein